MRQCMDWRTVNFDWNRARAFLVTAEEGSFSAAGRALNISQPTVGRQVAALEDELGVTLFERIGTKLQLTPTGLNLMEHVRAMGEAATRISMTAAGQSLSIAGRVSISASETIAAHLLPPIVTRLRRAYPSIELDIVANNQASDLQRREADIAIRNFRPKSPDLMAKKLSDSRGHFYASRAYIERVGGIEGADDLVKTEIFGFDHGDVMVGYLTRLDIAVTHANFPVVTGNHLVQWALCKAGAGICIIMEAVGDAEPSVERLPNMPVIPVPMWLVCHRELHTSRRIRLVFDFLADALSH